MNGSMRTCPTTGLQVHSQADALIKANAVVATVALLIGGVAAILVLLTRWQAVHLLDVVWFYRLLTVHGMNMLIFFIIFNSSLYPALIPSINCSLLCTSSQATHHQSMPPEICRSWGSASFDCSLQQTTKGRPHGCL